MFGLHYKDWVIKIDQTQWCITTVFDASFYESAFSSMKFWNCHGIPFNNLTDLLFDFWYHNSPLHTSHSGYFQRRLKIPWKRRVEILCRFQKVSKKFIHRHYPVLKISKVGLFCLFLQFRYSEKATKIWPIFHLQFDATK